MKKLLSMTAAAFFIATTTYASPMSLNIHNSDLRSTIMLVAKTGNLNVSVDDSVSGKISITISDSNPEDILDIIAKTKNLKVIRNNNVFIITAEQNSSLMQSYILPIRYGDADILRQAVVMSLDPDIENIPDYMTRTRNSDGSYSYRYSYRERDDDINRTSPNTATQRLKRDDRVIINHDTNSLILFGTESEYQRASTLLTNLDVELKQVSLEAQILAVDKEASKNLGVEWFWSAVPQYPERDIETRETRSGNVIVTEEYTRQANENTGYGIIQFGRGPEGIPFEWYYGARINSLVTNGKAKILSRPNITTIQGHEAVINVGSSVPIPRYETTNATTTTTIEYRDAGIILKYTPRVNGDGTITATIHTEVSTPQYVSDLKAYRFNTRSADSVVTVRDGEAMVIGGLIGAEESKAVRKIPFLGDLPILGALFRNNRKSNDESELMIFLTAHVIEGPGIGAPANVSYHLNKEDSHESLPDKSVRRK